VDLGEPKKAVKKKYKVLIMFFIEENLHCRKEISKVDYEFSV
jgi:hypothetical protein